MAAKHTWKLPLQICYNDAGWQKLENDGATCDGWCANDIACADGYCFGCYGISMCAGAGGRRLLEAPPPASKSTEVHVPGRNLAECEDATDGLVATLSEEALGRTLSSCAEVKLVGGCEHELAKMHCPQTCGLCDALGAQENKMNRREMIGSKCSEDNG